MAYSGLPQKDFFKELSKHFNYLSEETVRDYYYQLIRFIIKELKQNGQIRMPDWGDFAVFDYKERRIIDVRTRKHEIIKPTRVIKFNPCTKLKVYIKNSSKN